MGFWDTPEHHPSTGWRVGESREGTITGLEVATNGWGRTALRYTLDGQSAWASSTLWRTLADARVDLGDRIRITKTAEEQSNGKTRSLWAVQRLAPGPAHPVQTQPPAPAPVLQQGPSW